MNSTEKPRPPFRVRVDLKGLLGRRGCGAPRTLRLAAHEHHRPRRGHGDTSTRNTLDGLARLGAQIPPMLVLGHRGAPREAPENTLASFDAALRVGADGVELDVRLCASGEVVCCHDPTLLRLAGEEVRVRTTAWSDLRRYDLGGATLCLLGDVLELWSGRGVVNVELKSDDTDAPALVRAALDVIADAPRCAVIVSCFDPSLLDAVAALAPRLARGQLIPPFTRAEAAGCLAALDRSGLAAVHPWHVDATPERIAAWRARGFDVNVWTVDDPARAVALRDAGAAAVITNVPAALASVQVEGGDAGRREAHDRLLERRATTSPSCG